MYSFFFFFFSPRYGYIFTYGVSFKSFLSNQLQILSLKLDRFQIYSHFIGLKLNFFPEYILHVIGHPVYHEEIISSGNSKIRRAPTINSRVAFNSCITRAQYAKNDLLRFRGRDPLLRFMQNGAPHFRDSWQVDRSFKNRFRIVVPVINYHFNPILGGWSKSE